MFDTFDTFPSIYISFSVASSSNSVCLFCVIMPSALSSIVKYIIFIFLVHYTRIHSQSVPAKLVMAVPSTVDIELGENDLETGRRDQCIIKTAYKGASVAPPSLADIPVTYHYLTFETELPSASTSRLSNDGALPEPSLPNLKKYSSPFTWSESRKAYTIYLSCAVTVVTAYSAGSYGSATAQLSDYWGISQVAVYVGITTFTVGFAIAPMILAPFSEINGRYPVFVATGLLFVVCQLFCAITRSYPGMLVARFFVGVGGSTFSTMVGGVVSDIYRPEDRNKPMALFTGQSRG